MRIWTREDECDLPASVAVMGSFDGLHLGHQALIARARAIAGELGASCVVCTFDRHPLTLLDPARAPVPLLTQAQKLEKMEKLGVDCVLLKPFTRAYAATEPRDYLEMLSRRLRLKALVAGFNYRFGAQGRGDAALIRAMADPLGYRAEIVDAVMDGPDVVSSTLIRALIARGELARAQRLLAIPEARERMG